MKKVALTVAVLALGLAACGGQSGKGDAKTEPGKGNTVDECPRGDGQPCA